MKLQDLNITHAEHGTFALLMQGLFVLVGHTLGFPMSWWCGAAFAIAWFVSREHTQREYKLFNFGEENDLSPFAGFTGWSIDAWLDAIVPTVVVLVAGAVYQWWLG